ncbi:2-oxoacid:acceptor oxidoreductase subunit alpha [Alkaliphilus hydrothermalis]|uniref:2-oxoglutarate ferredoxin oxidoreductase subunit alpha n=1 Tax=Alkaliphilus hydrothermalis TaxID=1482730 RepID=A0ABS2NNI5_9FIRM|nr:2-oxoacid:acceptor oxidoreductase subunit alpha [Alkaliphilus hydrothermalis]MBM7614486.1 2-oxoglutarate ferredoxin oxidoreductase subunit alpha [Alkaliphilus hydrothermalis]
MKKYNLLIGGSAGQGMDTLAHNIEKLLQRSGYHLFSNKDYESRVRGGHNFTQIRFGTEVVTSHSNDLDLIIALNTETIEVHKERLLEVGTILCDETILSSEKGVISLPIVKSAREAGDAKTQTIVAFGIFVKLFDLDLDLAKKVIASTLKPEILSMNEKALDLGYSLIDKSFEIEKPESVIRMMINGNQAIGLGALAGGVTFYAAYPMTPSTSIMTYLASKQAESDVVVEQAEDEIAAINMALGASYAGIRAMTGTSGGGFSLMTETLGLSGIAELPLVIVNVQRPGPATGLPTRTEQSDLSFILTASHGEIPRMVLAVRNVEDAFYQTTRALNIADKYQIPVIILNDQYLADANQTIKPFDLSKVTIERNLTTLDADTDEIYNRYQFTENGISPRIIPGKVKGQVVLIDSDEHDQSGHIIEDAETRIKMMQKRMNKLEMLKEILMEPSYFGVEKPEILLVGWGSTEGNLKEAVEELIKNGKQVGALVFGDIYPLPTKLLEQYLGIASTVINVEQNYTGQLAKLIRQETGIKMDKSLLKYDGRQIAPHEIVDFVGREVR